MGILNLTPDSFSDGGKFNTLDTALRRVEEMEKEGADIIDIGAESTGPGSKDVSLEEERDRLFPILEKIRENTSLPISLDTYKAEIANQALDLGIEIINDVTGLRGDEGMAQIIAKHQSFVIIMYAKDNSPRTTIQPKRYDDIILEIKSFFQERINYCLKNGISIERIILDPGMGHFLSSNPSCSLEVIDKAEELKSFGLPIMLGISRKSFLGEGMKTREKKEQILSLRAHENGVQIFRTHNVGRLRETFFEK